MPDPIYGSGALMGSHGLHSIDRTFRRMWLDPRRAIVINIVSIVIIITIVSFSFFCVCSNTPSMETS